MRNPRLLYLLPFLLLFLLGGCAAPTPAPDGSASSSAAASSEAEAANGLLEGTFVTNAEGNPFGTVYVRGYASVEKLPEAFCEKDCPIFDYVWFHVTDTGNAAFRDFLDTQAGNSYVGIDPLRVGLGCVEDGVISYENHSDRDGRKTVRLPSALSRAILDATRDRPVALRLTKAELTAGSGAPTCYSHMTEVSPWPLDGAASSSAASADPFARVPAADGCKIAGCSAQLCVEAGDDGLSNCEWRDAYACYRGAVCERQASGSCGWTATPELTSCLERTR